MENSNATVDTNGVQNQNSNTPIDKNSLNPTGSRAGDSSSSKDNLGDRQGGYVNRNSSQNYSKGKGNSSTFRNNKFRNNKFFFKKKFCHFKKNGIQYVDYKDVDTLKRFVSKAGQITSPRFTGTSHKYQRKLSQAIKRARFMALLPYVGHIERERPNYAGHTNSPARHSYSSGVSTTATANS